MRGRRYSDDRIEALLREVARRRADGESLLGACKALGISPSSHRRWRKRFGTDAEAGLTRERTDAEEGRTDDQSGTPAQNPKLTDEAKKLLDAANTASGAARNAWLAFLLLLAYFLVTLAGVSHRDLLLNDPVTLPIVNVEIPLFSFFGFAPALLLLVYLSLLIQHVILARKYRDYAAAIAPSEAHARREHPSRQTVHSYVVSQLLAGPKTNFVMNRLMRLMVAVAFVVLPIGALLYFQLKFLPYHDVPITYWHRIALLLGLAMVLVLLPMMQLVPRKREVVLGPPGLQWRKTRTGIAAGLVLAAGVLGFSWLIATVPEEDVDEWLGFAPHYETPSEEWTKRALLNPVVRAIYDHIPKADSPDQEGWLLDWLLAYRVLVVEDEDMVQDKDDPHGEVSVVLRDRDLRFARLSRSDLHRADLTSADLRGAKLASARLEDVKLEEAALQGADLRDAELQRADFKNAKLHRASLSQVQAQEANFESAELQRTALNYANLQGARLRDAALYGARLARANLQGADLVGASLHGAYLARANLQGADLADASLHGADLKFADLRGADLSRAKLHGADLQGAKLHATNLEHAKFYGASFSIAELDGALFWYTKVWLAAPAPVLPPATPVGLNKLILSPLTARKKAGLERDLAGAIKDAEVLATVGRQLRSILSGGTLAWKDEAQWRNLRRTEDPAPEDISLFLAKTACNDPTGYVAKSLVRQDEWSKMRATQFGLKSDSDRVFVRMFAEKLLDESCVGAQSLPDDVKARLRALVATADAESDESPSGGEGATP